MSASIDAIRKANRSVSNRIQSILDDAEFVRSAQLTYCKPVVPNKRCGLWYVPPADRAAEACFKSTDGHTGQWGFSLKRLNLHLLPLINAESGCMLVDSTRRGKRMPDAFSKTVPIWCAVLNCALLGMDVESACYFPSGVVASSEIDQIKALMPQWIETFKREIPESMYERLQRPLRPLWITPDAPLPETPFSRGEDIIPHASTVILCTASRQAQDGELYLGYNYVQGAADDHELWAPKPLMPELLYNHSELRERGISDAELIGRIDRAAMRPSLDTAQDLVVIAVTPTLSIAHADPSLRIDGPLIDLRPINDNTWGLPAGKRGARELASKLPEIAASFETKPAHYIVVSAHNTDFAEVVALMLDCRFCDAQGNILGAANLHVSKEEVTRRNMRIIASTGNAPSRTSQNIVGSFLRGSGR